jgi:hypothetical protein
VLFLSHRLRLRGALALAFAGIVLLIVLIARGAAADPTSDPSAGMPDQATLLIPATAGQAPQPAAPSEPPQESAPQEATLEPLAEAPPAEGAAAESAPAEAFLEPIGDEAPITDELPIVAEAPVAPMLVAEEAPGYLSPITAAPKPFTNLLLRWEAAVPAGAGLQIEVRVSLDGAAWSEWGPVSVNPELWMPEDGPEVFWGEDMYAGEGAQLWQVRATYFAAPDGALPQLRRVDVNTVDARFGPPEPQPDTLPPGMFGLLSRPAVVSRTAWGSPDGQGSRVAPAYRGVTHMVIHHTADSNSLASGQRWSDRVRAIWSFHTVTRGWGDIGYNFLIDPSGVIYEGRAGGDNAVAFHDTANYGSMGVSMIGTYNTAAPSDSAINSLVDLLTWKADQRDIDPMGRSFYYGCSISKYCSPFNAGSIVNTISGHRDVTPGHTTCPGDRLASMIPGIRERVQARLSGGEAPPDNGDLTIDNRESSFERSAAQWYESSCGLESGSVYTFATDNPAESTNRAVWRANLPAAGRYQVLVHIPQGCNLGQLTTRALYRVSAANGVQEVAVNQSTAGEWVSLGSHDFAAGNQGSVELTDLTGEALSSQRLVFFDSVRWVKEDPAAAKLDVLQVSYDRSSVPAGELLKVTFTVKNSGPIAIEGQAPQAGSSYSLADSYVYEEGECFQPPEGQGYPSYPKELGRIRVMLGPADPSRLPACGGDSGGYPWRWGINGRLEPGEVREVVGYLRLRTPGVLSLQAGAINEYVGYLAQGSGAATITVTPERQLPAPAAYDELLRPLAHVYRLGDAPDNLLARSQDAGAALRGAYAGSFPWHGEMAAWGDGGPLPQEPALVDRFLVEQTRVFVAPVSGAYTFRITAADGGWLWVDGQLVAGGAGGQDGAERLGTMTLSAGRHVLSYKGLERGGAATMGYAVQQPGAAGFLPVQDGLGGAGVGGEERLGASFRQLGGLTLAADDMGGAGVARLLVSTDGGELLEHPGGLATLGPLADGWHSVRYKAVDSAGNESEERSLRFRVDSAMVIYRTFVPLAVR